MVKKRNSILLGISACILILSVSYGIYWQSCQRWYEHTDDAYVSGDMISIPSQVGGKVLEICFQEHQFIRQGQMLLKLDPIDYQIEYEKKRANLEFTVRQIKEIYNQVDIKKNTVELKEVELNHAKFNFEKRKMLISQDAIPLQEFEDVKAAFNSAELNLKLAKCDLKNALILRGNGPLEEHPKLKDAEAQFKQAYLNLQRCAIISPCDGFIAQKKARTGEYLSATKPIATIVPLSEVWIEANFKEDQLVHLRKGLKASIQSDLYGSQISYTGLIDSIGIGTGSVFSILPPQNATGNWIKVIQRVPVKIKLDKQELERNPLLLGLSTKVTIHLDKNLDRSSTTIVEMKGESKEKISLSLPIGNKSDEELERKANETIQSIVQSI